MPTGPGIIFYSPGFEKYEMYQNGRLLDVSPRLQTLRNRYPQAIVAMSALKQEERGRDGRA